MSEDVKVVYNACYGGFSLSPKAGDLYEELSGKKLQRYGDYVWGDGVSRSDPFLVQVVETLGKDASGQCAKLAITTVPKGCLYRIDEYDGLESVETPDTMDWTVA